MKRTRVGNQRHVNTFGNLFCNSPAYSLAQIVDHFADRRSGRVNPVYRAEMRACRVMIDVDCELVFKAGDSRTLQVGTFDEENGVVLAVDRLYIADLVGAGQSTIRERNFAANDDFGVFPERTEK